MKMQEIEKRFDFHGLGLAIKQAREERGWTQAYLAELVGRTDRTIMNIENKGQHPSFNTAWGRCPQQAARAELAARPADA